MNLQKIILLVVGGIIVLPIIFSLLFELWKKFWLTTVGEVVSSKTVRRLASAQRYNRQKGGISVTIHYRYVTQDREYFGTESKVFDVEYYKEKETTNEIAQQFPVGGKIAVYHPRLTPEISSITPGGAYVMKLLGLILSVFLWLLWLYLCSNGPDF